MKFSAFIAIVGAIAPASAIPQYLSTRDFVPQEWIAPTAGDSRGPCPGLNTLANHGYIPRDGKDIDLKKLAAGMLSGYNIEYSDALLLCFDPVLMVHDFEPHAWMFSSNNELFDGGESILRNEAVVGESVQARARSTEVVWTRSLPFVATAGTDVDEIMEFADRQGIVVIDETAAVGLSLSLMGGVQGEAPANVWEGLDTHAAHEESIRQLIRRDGIRRTKDEENCEPNTLRSACALSKMPGASMTSPKYPRTVSFDLADLGRHNILEHDISLSRSDAYFADPNPFNETVWAESLTYFPDDMITVEQVAKARMGRLATSKKTNPEHSLSKLADGFSWGEMASFFEIMADGTTGTVEKKFIEYWLKDERLPTEIGWQRRTKTMQGSERVAFTKKLMEAAGVARRDITHDAYGRKMN
ncbi:hypothetical protein Q7P36_007032 [Cladosporium allicinum]